MPARPDRAEDNARGTEANASRKTRQRIAAPADLFARLHRCREDRRWNHHEPDLSAEHRPRTEGDAMNSRRGEPDDHHVAEREDPPSRLPGPSEDTAHERVHTGASLSAIRERHRDERWREHPNQIN